MKTTLRICPRTVARPIIAVVKPDLCICSGCPRVAICPLDVNVPYSGYCIDHLDSDLEDMVNDHMIDAW